jgi:hypothetical protein
MDALDDVDATLSPAPDTAAPGDLVGPNTTAGPEAPPLAIDGDRRDTPDAEHGGAAR